MLGLVGVVREILDEAALDRDLPLQLLVGLLEVLEIGVEPAVAAEELPRVLGPPLDEGDRVTELGLRELGVQGIDEALVGRALRRAHEHEDRRAAAEAREALLERHEPGAVPREQLEHVGLELEVARVHPRGDHQDERGEHHGPGAPPAEVDEALDHAAHRAALRVFGGAHGAPPGGQERFGRAEDTAAGPRNRSRRPRQGVPREPAWVSAVALR